ncbi:1,4-alpha-glucan branching enzyme [Solemya pervernicosa gill symbiont]|uniref:1,4-alpha-glucan branching enzyme GlgB n=2 Tax=Gammaproteobacteria incertae sedis TaxID=118884 RepID=A0A1T2LAM7_9GAMM|nr:1,4-alpha-glucan branching protein GlgB [Candidatus Reidiella endopervernicosa]OOZ42155.1 1,4-alpha-glucan branching enzyme [Solemya pervernicosa gill symbiont]QKQ27277.1 1,4-alpha-glucan branching protein GlgB [Candidatus Reidiella endopervernicosa]
MEPIPTAAASISESLQRLLDARHHDPFNVLGLHKAGKESVVRVYIPSVASVELTDIGAEMTRIPGSDIFEWRGDTTALPERYQLSWCDSRGEQITRHDPYCFPPQIGDLDMHLFGEGRHRHAYRMLGAHPHTADGIDGVRFCTWAPAAERVSIVGDFNSWDGRTHPMRVRGGSGIWELFIPDLQPGINYKFEICNRDSGEILLKSDPYGQQFEMRPETASIVRDYESYGWGDESWIETRAKREWQHEPMSTYEVHLSSWQLDDEGNFLNYRELAHRLVDYVEQTGFTHIELLPITEHPFDGSWGYQTIGYYAPTSRFGTPDDFRYFVDYCHQHGIGVLLDWAPGHFPKDAHGLANFDGTALYEHEDPRLGEHRDWGTLIFNYGRNEVKNFLIASAVYWLEEFHIDGLRVDAVASMLYLDYSREEGDWLPNRYGGNENLEAIDFLRELNEVTHGEHPGTLMIAEESTSWPQVTRPTWVGGLGFSMKWNMGWMHDSLDYMSKDPIHRHFHHERLTFGLLYAFSENFVLPFSHDEVVHGKGSMLGKMPGDEWQRFANLRLLYTYYFTYPGKKLLFMGSEFAQGGEWNHDRALDWWLLDSPLHNGMKQGVGDLNRLYRELPALHHHDFDHSGFDWVDCHDASQSVLAYQRSGGGKEAVIILNFTPVPRENYRIGLPCGGRWREAFNSDSHFYGGSDIGNSGTIEAEATPWMNREHSIALTLPPLAGVVLVPED